MLKNVSKSCKILQVIQADGCWCLNPDREGRSAGLSSRCQLVSSFSYDCYDLTHTFLLNYRLEFSTKSRLWPELQFRVEKCGGSGKIPADRDAATRDQCLIVLQGILKHQWSVSATFLSRVHRANSPGQKTQQTSISKGASMLLQVSQHKTDLTFRLF